MDREPAEQAHSPDANVAAGSPEVSTACPASEPEGPATPDVDLAEPEAPMDRIAHVHAPHGGIASWRDFFVHIVVVAIGLLLALGLEQTVEYLHHQSERAALETEMHETFAADIKVIEGLERKLGDYRAFLIELRAAVAARLNGRDTPTPPLDTDPRNNTVFSPPNLGPFEALKANGTVALLDLEKIRLYERLEFQHSRMMQSNLEHFTANNDLRAFRERFDLPPTRPYGIAPVDPASLSTPQLIEYQTLLGRAIQTNIAYASRFSRLRAAYRAVLDGARSEREVMDAINNSTTEFDSTLL